jgi:hypothetical protein
MFCEAPPMQSSQYNFVSITRTSNIVDAVMTAIAFCFNKTLTVYYFTNVSTITPLVLTLIALFPYVQYFIL